MTTAATDIRTHAKMFGWNTHTDPHHGDTFIHGEHMVAVNYRRDGTIDTAKRYSFWNINDLRLQEVAPEKHKKTAVLAWLIGHGS